jgi:hypothetical protein
MFLALLFSASCPVHSKCPVLLPKECWKAMNNEVCHTRCILSPVVSYHSYEKLVKYIIL